MSACGGGVACARQKMFGAYGPPTTSTPFAGAYLNVPVANAGLRFQPENRISVRWPTASFTSMLTSVPLAKARRAVWKLASPSFFGVRVSHCTPP